MFLSRICRLRTKAVAPTHAQGNSPLCRRGSTPQSNGRCAMTPRRREKGPAAGGQYLGRLSDAGREGRTRLLLRLKGTPRDRSTTPHGGRCELPFNLPSASSSSAGRPGGSRRACLSPGTAGASCGAAPADRAAQSTRRSRATQWARLLLGYFFLARQEEVPRLQGETQRVRATNRAGKQKAAPPPCLATRNLDSTWEQKEESR